MAPSMYFATQSPLTWRVAALRRFQRFAREIDRTSALSAVSLKWRAATAHQKPRFHPHPVLVNGVAGLLCTLEGKPFSVMSFSIKAGKIAEIHILHDPERLRGLDLSVLQD